MLLRDSLRNLLFGLSFTLSACATGPGHPIVEDPLARAWISLSSPHIRLQTDKTDAEARKLLTELERLRTAYLAAIWKGQPVEPDVVDVIAFDQAFELDDLMDKTNFDAVFTRDDGVQTLVAMGSGLRNERHAANDLALHLQSVLFPREPTWFGAGLEYYLGAIKISDDSSQVLIGLMGDPVGMKWGTFDELAAEAKSGGGSISWGRAPTHETGRMPVARLLTYGIKDYDFGLEENRFFGTSSLMLELLLTKHPTALADFERRLLAGEDPTAAWAAIFPGVTPDQLDQELTVFVKEERLPIATMPMHFTPPEISAAMPMTAADVHAIRALLVMRPFDSRPVEKRRELAAAEVTAALVTDPGQVTALEVQRSWLGDAASLAPARLATQRHPDDSRAWLLLANCEPATSEGNAERLAALEHAGRLAPNVFSVQLALANAELTAGHPDKALEPSVRAMKLGKLSAEAAHVLAGALVRNQRACEAVTVERQAIQLVEPAHADRRATFQSALESIQRHCGGQPVNYDPNKDSTAAATLAN